MGRTSGGGNVVQAPTAANVLDGFQTFNAATGATTVIQVPAGRTWVGTVAVSVAVSETAAGVAQGQAATVVTTAGAGVTPAAGAVARVDCFAAVNAAAGTTGTNGANNLVFPLVVIAPAGNPVQVQANALFTGTIGQVSVSCIGALQ